MLRTGWGESDLGWASWNCVCDDGVLFVQLPLHVLFSFCREMVALRLSTLAVPRQISSMKGKSMDSRRGDPICSQLHLLSGWQEGLGTSLDLTITENQMTMFSKAVQIHYYTWCWEGTETWLELTIRMSKCGLAHVFYSSFASSCLNSLRNILVGNHLHMEETGSVKTKCRCWHGEKLCFPSYQVSSQLLEITPHVGTEAQRASLVCLLPVPSSSIFPYCPVLWKS